MDYLVEKYDSGKPFYPSNDFMIWKEKLSDDNAIPMVTEFSKSKWKSVERASVVIINTRQAELDMMVLPYPECTDGQVLVTWDITDTLLSRSRLVSRSIKLITGAVYTNHTG